MYIYPENLEGKSTLFLWTLKDLIIIVIGLVISVAMMAVMNFIVPIVITGVYAFLSLRVDSELNISDYIRFAVCFFITTQQMFFWKGGGR